MPNVVGLFDSRSEAHLTVQQLVNSGFDREDISLVSQDIDNRSNDGVPTRAGVGARRNAHRASRHSLIGA